MTTSLIVKSGDIRDWTITLSDVDGVALNLTGVRVKFRMKRSEQDSTNFFGRDTEGTASDYISISDTPSTGIVTITPTLSDYAELSDMYGVYVSEFLLIDSADTTMILNDVEINIQESNRSLTAVSDSLLLIDLATHSNAQIDDRLGDDPALEKPLWAIRDHTTPNYVRNSDSWLSDVDLTCHSVWQSRGNVNQRCATLITPDAFVANWHYRNTVGDTFRFVGTDNTIYTRTMTARQQIPNIDLYVGLFDSVLPSTVIPVKILPANFEDYSSVTWDGGQVALMNLDQEDKGNVRALLSLLANLSGLNAWFHTPVDPTRLTYYEAAESGDSSDPIFFIINGEAILLATFQGTTWGPATFSFLDEINGILSSLGSPYTTTEVDLSGFRTY